VFVPTTSLFILDICKADNLKGSSLYLAFNSSYLSFYISSSDLTLLQQLEKQLQSELKQLYPSSCIVELIPKTAANLE
jgi:hypothetical protein